MISAAITRSEDHIEYTSNKNKHVISSLITSDLKKNTELNLSKASRELANKE